MKNTKSACFIGHRTIPKTQETEQKIYNTIEKLITTKQVNTFYFGSKSQFNDLCYEQVTKLKKIYPHIKRIYLRAEYPVISKDYEDYLLEQYEETEFPQTVLGAGKVSYIKRNYEMINRSDFCVIYYDKTFAPANRTSGTELALDYAVKKQKQVINLAQNQNHRLNRWFAPPL